jgi:hypothetical protein
MTGYKGSSASIKFITDPNSQYNGLLSGYNLGSSHQVDFIPYIMRTRSDGKVEIKITDVSKTSRFA